MKYQITFVHREGGWERLTPAQQQEHNADLAAFVADLEREKGARLVFFGAPGEARTVRRDENGAFSVEEGTHHGLPEFAGGYYVIEAGSMEEALEWARRGRFMPGANEVRQLLG